MTASDPRWVVYGKSELAGVKQRFARYFDYEVDAQEYYDKKLEELRGHDDEQVRIDINLQSTPLSLLDRIRLRKLLKDGEKNG
jgi:hypothetical protein